MNLEQMPMCVYVCACAVSYTHLDVYKRQSLGRPKKKEVELLVETGN